MSKYSIPERDVQVVKPTNVLCVVDAFTGKDKAIINQSAKDIYVDTSTGQVVEELEDDKFPWKERKKGTLRLADAYEDGKMIGHSERAKTCSTWLEYLATAKGDKRQLNQFNACHMRLCPICSARKARIMAIRLRKVLEKTLNDNAGTQLLFLTLTMENVTGDELKKALDLLTKAWKKLIDRRPFQRAVKGWFRAIEVTRNRSKDTYHPHIHAILVVEDVYFMPSYGLYLTHDKWVEMWQQCMKVNYRPIVGIQKTSAKAGKSGGGPAAAAVEAAKYATKSKDYIDKKLSKAEAAKVVAVYTNALARKRMTAMGGCILKASQELDIDIEANANLVHDGENNGDLTEASAEVLEEYNWHFGVGTHLLTSVKPNPAYEDVHKEDAGD